MVDTNNKPICVLEAKKEKLHPLVAKEQARKYAKTVDARFIILSNGIVHYLWDLKKGNPKPIYKFPSPNEIGAIKEWNPDRESLANEPVENDFIAIVQMPDYSERPEWKMVELGDIIDSLETGVSVNSENGEIEKDGFGVLKTSAVTYGDFRPFEYKKILETELSRAKCKPKKNSIIISRMNTEQLVGASAYVDKDFNNLYLPDRLWQTVITRKDVSAKNMFI